MAKAAATGRSAISTGLTMEVVEPFLQTVAAQMDAYRVREHGVAVTTDEEAEAAGAFGRELAKLAESAERQRKEFVGPLQEHVKLINSRFKAVTEPLMAIVGGLKKKIGDHWQAKQLAAQEAAKVEQKRLDDARAVEEARRRKAEEAARKKNKPSPTPPPLAPPPVVVAAAPAKTMGTTQVRLRWTFEERDLSAVPVEYLEVNGAKVRRTMADKKKEIEAGGQPIPGLHFLQVPDVAV